jgi:sialidase-1
MGVRVSTDEGRSWGAPHVVSGLPAAYSAMAMVGSDDVGLLYETGDWGPYARIEFARLPLVDLGLG